MREAGSASTWATVPCAITRPPLAPAPGPSSTSQSAAARMRASWSTMATELPSARRSRMTSSNPSMFGRVQADGRLVQHVEHAGRAVAHGAGQLHALALARGERGARAVEREVGKPQVHQARGRARKRLADALRHRAHLGRQPCGHARHPLHRVPERHLRGLGQVDARHLRLSRVLGQPRAAARAAGPLLQKPRHARKPLLVLHLRKRVLHGAHGVVVGEVELGEGVGLLRLDTGCASSRRGRRTRCRAPRAKAR